MNYQDLKRVVLGHKFIWFTKPYDLNFIGIRKDTSSPDSFDDLHYIAYIDALGLERVFCAPITTDPGLFYLKNPINAKGCAILMPGQWLGMWKKGLHQGKYKALVQVKPVTVIRDANRDGVIDYNSGVKETGLFGINYHYGSASNILKRVGNASAGCQVVPVKEDHDYVMALNSLQERFIQTSVTSYTLLLEKEL